MSTPDMHRRPRTKPAIKIGDSPLRAAFAWLIFPVVLLVTHGSLIAAMALGYSPALTVAIVSTLCATILTLCEGLQPHSVAWLKSKGDIGTDIVHLIFSTLLVPQAFDAIFRSVLLVGAAWVAGVIGVGLWPTTWPVVAQWALALLVGELGQYWWHRLAHERDSLWRFHATHHSSTRLYWLNSCRFHPVDSAAQYGLEIAPLVLLGCNTEVLALFTLSTAVIGMFQHANIELRAGALNWVFSLTELHRWHHSRDVSEGNSNYGANLIVWDVVFGTRYLPRDREFDATRIGLANMPNFPKRYLGQLLSPFRWRRVKAQAAAARSEPK